VTQRGWWWHLFASHKCLGRAECRWSMFLAFRTVNFTDRYAKRPCLAWWLTKKLERLIGTARAGKSEDFGSPKIKMKTQWCSGVRSGAAITDMMHNMPLTIELRKSDGINERVRLEKKKQRRQEERPQIYSWEVGRCPETLRSILLSFYGTTEPCSTTPLQGKFCKFTLSRGGVFLANFYVHTLFLLSLCMFSFRLYHVPASIMYWIYQSTQLFFSNGFSSLYNRSP
jgi:hypothetical protein